MRLTLVPCLGVLCATLAAAHGDETQAKPGAFSYEALPKELQDQYLKLLAAMGKAGRNDAAADHEVDACLQEFGSSPSPVVQAFVPLLTGVRQRARGEDDLAESSLKACLEKNPSESFADFFLSGIYQNARKLDLSEKHIVRFLDAHQDPKHYPDKLQTCVMIAKITHAGIAIDQQDFGKFGELLEEARALNAACSDAADCEPLLARLAAMDGVRRNGPSDWTFGKGGNAFKVASKHYVVLTDVSEPFARDLSQRMEAVRKLYVKEFAALGKPLERAPSTLIVFRTQESFWKFNEYTRRSSMKHVAGYFDNTSKFLVLWNDQSKGGQLAKTGKDVPEVFQTLYHEGCHQYLDLLLGEIPPWINEGIASMYENLLVAGDSATLRKDQDFIEYVQDAAQGVNLYSHGPFKPIEAVMALDTHESLAYPYFCILQYFLREQDPKPVKDLLLSIQKGCRDNRRLADIIYGKKGQKRMDELWLDYAKKMHR